MTTSTLLSAATQPVLGAAVALPAVCPEQMTFSLNLVNPNFYGQATVMGTTDGVDWVPLCVLQNAPGSPEPTSQQIATGAGYLSLRAALNNIVPGVGATATVTATY